MKALTEFAPGYRLAAAVLWAGWLLVVSVSYFSQFWTFAVAILSPLR